MKCLSCSGRGVVTWPVMPDLWRLYTEDEPPLVTLETRTLPCFGCDGTGEEVVGG